MLGTESPGRCADDALKREGPRVGSTPCRGPPLPGGDWRPSRGRARCGRYLKGSFTTTLTPAMTPVTALRTCWTACWLISPAPLMAPVAAAEAASSTLRPTCLAPEMAPSTAFLATVPISPPTSAALLTRVRALTLTVSIVSAPTSFVPLRTPTTPPLAAAPTSPPTWAVPMMAPRRTSDTVDVNAVPTAPVPLMVVTNVPLTVSTAAFRTSPVPLIEPTIWSFTDSMIPLRPGSILLMRDLLPGDELWSLWETGPHTHVDARYRKRYTHYRQRKTSRVALRHEGLPMLWKPPSSHVLDPVWHQLGTDFSCRLGLGFSSMIQPHGRKLSPRSRLGDNQPRGALPRSSVPRRSDRDCRSSRTPGSRWSGTCPRSRAIPGSALPTPCADLDATSRSRYLRRNDGNRRNQCAERSTTRPRDLDRLGSSGTCVRCRRTGGLRRRRADRDSRTAREGSPPACGPRRCNTSRRRCQDTALSPRSSCRGWPSACHAT